MKTGNKSETLRRILIPVSITLAVLLIIGLFLYMLAIPFNIYIIIKLYNYIVGRIVNISGINQWLVKGIVIISLIPLLWVIPHLYRGKHKKTARAIGFLYFGVFCFSLFFLSKDLNFAHSGKEILKWYALTPEGVKFFDSAGVDPIYGVTLKPVTPDVIRNLKLLQKGDFKPIDPVNAQFFNPITGEPQIWYYQYPDGSFEFYDKPGYHPITGEPLKPTTKQVYFEWREKNTQKSASPNKPESTKKGKEQIPATVQQPEISEKDKRLQGFKSLINPTISVLPGKTNIALVVDAPKKGLDISPESTLYNNLKSEKVHVIFDFFNERKFKSKGYFNELFNGNTELLSHAGVLSKIDSLILGKLTYSFRKDSQIDKTLVSCDITFNYKCFNKNGGIVRNENLTVIGAGFSESAALKRGIEMLSEKYSEQILKAI